jgi:hypothetical protein
MGEQHCPGQQYFDRVQERFEDSLGAVERLCGKIDALIKVACWIIAPLIVCVCAIAMGEKLFGEVAKHIPAAHAEAVKGE